mmetsp:Transcript_52471/g.114533  ORF Transcript_52471/g.114533 Transcript_52471/m.114533 type:complete len:86 (-) Transcript_52471:35-292(-)
MGSIASLSVILWHSHSQYQAGSLAAAHSLQTTCPGVDICSAALRQILGDVGVFLNNTKWSANLNPFLRWSVCVEQCGSMWMLVCL